MIFYYRESPYFTYLFFIIVNMVLIYKYIISKVHSNKLLCHFLLKLLYFHLFIYIYECLKQINLIGINALFITPIFLKSCTLVTKCQQKKNMFLFFVIVTNVDGAMNFNYSYKYNIDSTEDLYDVN